MEMGEAGGSMDHKIKCDYILPGAEYSMLITQMLFFSRSYTPSEKHSHH